MQRVTVRDGLRRSVTRSASRFSSRNFLATAFSIGMPWLSQPGT